MGGPENRGRSVEGNHNETVLGSTSIHVGVSGANRVLNSTLRKLGQGVGEIAPMLPIPGIRGFGAGVFSLFADKAINEVTAGSKSQFIGVTKTVTAGKSISYHSKHTYQVTSGSLVTLDAGDMLTASAGKAINIRCGESAIFMGADGYIRLTGKTLYLNFEDGVEVEGRHGGGVPVGHGQQYHPGHRAA